MRATIALLCLFVFPGTLDAQEVTRSQRQAIYTRVGEYAERLIHHGLGETVPRSEIRAWSSVSASGPLAPAVDPAERSALERAASSLSLKVARPEDAVVCKRGNFDCQSRDGSRAGFDIKTVAFQGPNATVYIEIWFLIEGYSRGSTVRHAAPEVIHLTRTDSGWEVVEK